MTYSKVNHPTKTASATSKNESSSEMLFKCVAIFKLTFLYIFYIGQYVPPCSGEWIGGIVILASWNILFQGIQESSLAVLFMGHAVLILL